MSTELEKLIMSAGDLPTMPVVATKVMRLIEDERATPDQLAKVVSSDPAVAARVLKISNSAFYGCQRQIQTLSAAVMVLGFNTLKSLVVTASVKEVFRPYGLAEKMLWEHCFGAGLAARIIAAKIRVVNGEESFLAGLFHDIGKIVMLQRDRDKFQGVLQRCYNEGISFQDAEREAYPFSHTDVGALVIRKWNFPEALVNAVQMHHAIPDAAGADFYQRTLTAVVSLADHFCAKTGVGGREPNEELDLNATDAAQILNLSADDVEELLGQFAETFERDKSFFQIG